MKSGEPKPKRLPADKLTKSAHEALFRSEPRLVAARWKTGDKNPHHWFNAESMVESQFGYGRDHSEADFRQPTEIDQ